MTEKEPPNKSLEELLTHYFKEEGMVSPFVSDPKLKGLARVVKKSAMQLIGQKLKANPSWIKEALMQILCVADQGGTYDKGMENAIVAFCLRAFDQQPKKVATSSYGKKRQAEFVAELNEMLDIVLRGLDPGTGKTVMPRADQTEKFYADEETNRPDHPEEETPTEGDQIQGGSTGAGEPPAGGE